MKHSIINQKSTFIKLLALVMLAAVMLFNITGCSLGPGIGSDDDSAVSEEDKYPVRYLASENASITLYVEYDPKAVPADDEAAEDNNTAESEITNGDDTTDVHTWVTVPDQEDDGGIFKSSKADDSKNKDKSDVHYTRIVKAMTLPRGTEVHDMDEAVEITNEVLTQIGPAEAPQEAVLTEENSSEENADTEDPKSDETETEGSESDSSASGESDTDTSESDDPSDDTAQEEGEDEAELTNVDSLPEEGSTTVINEMTYSISYATETYEKIMYDGVVYYIEPGHMTDSLDDIVRETHMYARTSVTIYEDQDGPKIASYLPKGSYMDIVSFGTLQEDGTIDMYQVKAGDVTGYVYGKYLTYFEEDALAPYNENGEYDIHKNRIFPNKELYGGDPTKLDFYPYEKPSFKDNPIVQDAHAMYLNYDCAAPANVDKYVELAKANGVNAVVMDVKEGGLAFPADAAREMNPTAYERAYMSTEEFAASVKKFQDAGIYTIARIVAFNDVLFGMDHPEECIDSPSSSQLWPSAFSRPAWYYNVSLAIECVEKFGFNEIQFDYLRFPETSYSMSADPNTDWRNVYNEDKCEALQNFAFYACDCIHKYGAYVSADVFGECSGEYVTSYGQYWPALSNILDAISSMPYVDHYGDAVDTWTDSYATVHNWAVNAAKRQTEIPTPAIPRTWITGYNVPHWNPTINCDDTMIAKQAQALYDAGLYGGFIPWNGKSSYEKYCEFAKAWSYNYMPEQAVTDGEDAGEGDTDSENAEGDSETDTEEAPPSYIDKPGEGTPSLIHPIPIKQ